MKILIIEDEPLAALKLKNYILRHMPQADIFGPLSKVSEVQDFFAESRLIELIFSDIELLDGPVFQALSELDLPCPVIYTTAYDAYWTQAFQNMGVEYLLKPFSYKRFIGAMTSFEQLKQSLLTADSKQPDPTGEPEYKQRFLLKKRQGMELLHVEDIICLRASSGIILAYDKEGQCHSLVQHSVTELEAQLDPKCFFRINRSDIVNIHFVQRFENYAKDTLAVLLLGLEEPLVTSKTKSSGFRRWLDS